MCTTGHLNKEIFFFRKYVLRYLYDVDQPFGTCNKTATREREREAGDEIIQTVPADPLSATSYIYFLKLKEMLSKISKPSKLVDLFNIPTLQSYTTMCFFSCLFNF